MQPAVQSHPLPADRFVDQVISALVHSDLAALRRLEAAAPSVAPPLYPDRYLHQHSTLAALIDATGRNLRLLRRVVQKRLSGPDGQI